MPKIVTLIPEIKVYSYYNTTFYEATEVSDKKYTCTITLPANLGEENIEYKFEAYANDVATGLFAFVTVECETIYNYETIKSFTIDPDTLSHEGGQVTITIDFNEPEEEEEDPEP